MPRKLLLALIGLILLFTLAIGCQAKEINSFTVVYKEGGVWAEGTEVYIGDYYKGARAEIDFLLENTTNQEIQPVISKDFSYDPEKSKYLEGKGYVACPSWYSDWIDVPKCGTLKPGESAQYSVILEIPENAPEEIPEKWTFVLIADGRYGGFTQIAPGAWACITMR